MQSRLQNWGKVMTSAGGARAGATGKLRSRAPRLAPELDPTSLDLTPPQAFLLSRVDGVTPLDVLRQMGAMAPADADTCFEQWRSSGVLVFDGVGELDATPSDPPNTAPVAIDASLDLDVDESQVDSRLDLPPATQRRILSFEQGLERPYHLLLSVAADADTRAIKRAYFSLSKEFHPDRYFRRDIGEYATRLDRIFKKVLEAYELLSDPATRKEVQAAEASRERAVPEPVAQATAPFSIAQGEESPRAERLANPVTPDGDGRAERAERSAQGGTFQRMQPLSKLERLKKRMPRRRASQVPEERRLQANQFFEAARHSKRMGRVLEAAASIRLAIAFDGSQPRFKEAFGEIQASVAEEKVMELLERDESHIEPSERREALKLCEEVLLYRPHDPEVNIRAASLALDLDQVDDALESAIRAVEHSPEVGLYHRVLGQVYQKKHDKGHALHHLKKAVDLDPEDAEARRILALYRRPSAHARAS